MKVPFADLGLENEEVRPRILPRFEQVIRKSNFILGAEVQEFEQAFAAYCGARCCVGLASGTDALHIACRAVGLGPGDEVILPANTFLATALGVALAGARVVLADVDERTSLLDPGQVERALSSRTRAIIPVHLYGRMMELDPILEIASARGLAVIEDAAQAHGAELGGKKAGTLGALGCFSFYPAKNLGAFGDAGAVVTNDPALATKVEALRNYGSPEKYKHPELGFNSRLDTLQAVVLAEKLPLLDGYNDRRRTVARRYAELLAGVGDLVLPRVPDGHGHVFHLYVVRSPQREAILAHLTERGIAWGIHYPTPIHLHGAFATLPYKKGDFPVAERLTSEIFSLPMFPKMTDEQVEAVAGALVDFFDR